MLKATALPEFLRCACTAGIEAALLFDENGALLGTSCVEGDINSIHGNTAAIASNAWEVFSLPPSTFEAVDKGQKSTKVLEALVMELEEGIIAIKGFFHGDRKFLVALRGDSSTDFKYASQQAELLAGILSDQFQKMAT